MDQNTDDEDDDMIGIDSSFRGKGDYRKGTAETVQEEARKGSVTNTIQRFVDYAPTGITKSVHVENLPNDGPWIVFANGAVDSGESIRIREGGLSGTEKGYLSSYGSIVDGTGFAIIYGREFYIQVPGGAVIFNIAWQQFTATENESIITEI